MKAIQDLFNIRKVFDQAVKATELAKTVEESARINYATALQNIIDHKHVEVDKVYLLPDGTGVIFRKTDINRHATRRCGHGPEYRYEYEVIPVAKAG